MTASFKRFLVLWGLMLAGLVSLPWAAGPVSAQDLLAPLTSGDDADEEEQQSSSLLDAISQESVKAELRLTNEQQSKIEQILKDFDEQAKRLEESVSEQLRGIDSIGERLRKTAELRGRQREQTDQLRQKAEQQLLSLLNDGQKAILQKRAAEFGAALIDGDRDRQDGSASSSAGRSYRPPTSDGPVVASFGLNGGRQGSLPESSGNTDADESNAADARSPNDSRVDPTNPTAGSSQSVSSTRREPTLRFRFQNAPWEQVLDLFAKAAGLTLNMRDLPPGEFTYFDDRPRTPIEALDVMNRYLMPDGFLLVRHDRFLTVFDTSKGIPPNIIQTVSLEELPRRGETELVRVVFPLDERDASKTAEEIRRLLGPQGQVSALDSANSLVVTDVAKNLIEVQALLGLDPKVEKDEMVFRSFALRYVSAYDVAEILKSLFPQETKAKDPGTAAAERLRSNTFSRWSRFRGSSGFGGFGMFRGRGDGDRRSESSSSGSSRDTGSDKSPTVAVAVDARSNRVLVRARQADMKIIDEAVKALDVEQVGSTLLTNVPRVPDEPYLQVYELKAADVDDVVQTLQAIYPDAMFNEDDDTDRIHAYATEEQHRMIAMQIRQIDGAVGGDSLAVIPLGPLNGYEAATMVSSLYLRDGQSAPSVQVDPYGRNLIVRGSPTQVSQIRTLLAQYGAGGAAGLGRAAGSQSGPMIRMPMSNPDEIARLIERLWSVSNPNPIRIIPRERRSPVQPPVNRSGQRREAPDEGRRRPSRTDAALDGDEHRLPGGGTVFTVSRLQPAADQTETLPEGAADPAEKNQSGNETNQNEKNEQQKENGSAEQQKGAQAKPSAPPIYVSVEDGELVIVSEDQEALARLQALIGSLARTSPNRTNWKVFYLRVADATEVATMLGQLLPVAPTTGTLASNGFTISGPGVQTLQIIPESRMNALFVTGPADQVRDVEQFLKVLDSDELPASLRDRVPRSITVRYANVSEVAEIIQSVYQDYMQPPARSRTGGFFGRSTDRNSNNSGAGPNGVRLTLGVDTRTSQLIVSCNDSLYREIEELVRTLDEAAYEADQVVRVVASDNAAVVAETLDALFPQVTISTTASPPGQPGSTTRSSSSRGQSGNADAERAERIRRFMEFRERMLRGGGGFPFRGGPGGPRGFDSRGGRPEGRGGESRGGFFSRGGGDRGSRFGGRR